MNQKYKCHVCHAQAVIDLASKGSVHKDLLCNKCFNETKSSRLQVIKDQLEDKLAERAKILRGVVDYE